MRLQRQELENKMFIGTHFQNNNWQGTEFGVFSGGSLEGFAAVATGRTPPC